MRRTKTLLISVSLVAATSAVLPVSRSLAGTTYTYTGGAFAGSLADLGFTTSLTGVALDNLAPGTDISSTVSGFSVDVTAASSDQGGFPIGGPLGSSYQFLTLAPVVQIGTDAVGNITSWSISADLFASYPAIPAEDPNDFYCTYSISTTTTTDAINLTLDNDAGFCPPSASGSAGTFAPIAQVPPPSSVSEPGSFAVFGSGIVGLLGVVARRKWLGGGPDHLRGPAGQAGGGKIQKNAPA